MTVRGGDSWCSLQQYSAPTIPGKVEGLVIVIKVVIVVVIKVVIVVLIKVVIVIVIKVLIVIVIKVLIVIEVVTSRV